MSPLPLLRPRGKRLRPSHIPRRIAQSRLSAGETLDPSSSIRESLDGLFHEVEVAEKTAQELGRMVVAGRQAVPASGR